MGDDNITRAAPGETAPGNAEPIVRPSAPARADGNLDRVPAHVLAAAADAEAWIAARRSNWPTRARTAARIDQAAAEEVPAERSGSSVARTSGSEAGSLEKSGARQRGRVLCKYFAAGRCRNDRSCRFSHQLAESVPAAPRGPRVYKRFEAPVRGALFLKLVQNDHDAEDERILDFIARLSEEGHLS